MTRYSRPVPLLALLALFTTSGCILVGGGGGGVRGDVTVLWTFGGRTCAQVPEVTAVKVQIPGETLANNGIFNCANSGTAGITLLDFAPRTYSYTISGLNQAGQAIYSRSGTFTVNGDVTVNADLQANASATGSAYVTWTFPAQSPVTCANLAAVDIEINGAPYRSANCAEGTTSPGVLISNLTAGTNTITLLARDSGNFFYYRTDASFTVTPGASSSQQFTLAWAVGSLPLKWTFTNTNTQFNCAGVGVTTVNVNLRDAMGNYLYGTAGTDVPCRANNLEGTVFPYLYAGTYQVFLQAYGTGSVLYRSNFTIPATGTVTAGQFPTIDSPTPTPVTVLSP